MLIVSDAQLQAWLIGVLLPFFRILAIFTAAPVLSMRAIPVRVRIALALLMTVTLAPSVPSPTLSWAHSGMTLTLIGYEIGIGLAIGFIARLVFAAFDVAGEVIGLQMGLSYAGFFDPLGARGNAVGALMNSTASALFVAMNGILVLLTAILSSFVNLPIGQPSLAFTSQVDAVQAGRALFASGLLLAMPFMTLIGFVNLLMGVVSRIAPQLSLFSVGFPITVGVGLLLLVTGLPWLEAPLSEALNQLLLRLATPPR